MKIGIFDSGIGGLIVTRAITRALPEYDYVYLGDTQRVPYGPRSEKVVQQFTREALEYLFKKENCSLVILACNTASARALRKMQKEFPNRKILGVLIPAAEEAGKYKRIGVIGTAGTVASNSFPKEIKKARKKLHPADGGTRVFQNPAPMLVPLAEAGEKASAPEFIKKYLKPLIKQNIDALVLGCTHYPIFKKEIKKEIGKSVKIISQDEIVPKKLKNYLVRHPEIEKKLNKKARPGQHGRVKILVTDKTETIEKLAASWFGKVKPKLIFLS